MKLKNLQQSSTLKKCILPPNSPSKDDESTALPDWVNVSPVTAALWSSKLTKQKHEEVDHSFTYGTHNFNPFKDGKRLKLLTLTNYSTSIFSVTSWKCYWLTYDTQELFIVNPSRQRALCAIKHCPFTDYGKVLTSVFKYTLCTSMSIVSMKYSHLIFQSFVTSLFLNIFCFPSDT